MYVGCWGFPPALVYVSNRIAKTVNNDFLININIYEVYHRNPLLQISVSCGRITSMDIITFECSNGNFVEYDRDWKIFHVGSSLSTDPGYRINIPLDDMLDVLASLVPESHLSPDDN